MATSRRAEEQAIADFLDAAQNSAHALLIEGEAGIGKTTLWLDVLQRAEVSGLRVLSARAAVAESVLAYTALADLLADVDDAMWVDLPAPQRHALGAPLLRHPGDASATDARAVAAAFLAVVKGLVAEGPLVLAIDDLQWLDTSTANALLFAARRLPDGVGVLYTVRTDAAAVQLQLPSPDAVRRIRLQPLTVGGLHQVLVNRMGQSFPRPTLLHIHDISGGNPFYALELAREITTRGSSGELALPGSLAELVRTRVGRVSGDAEDALLAIASLADPTVQLVARATETAPDRVVELLGDAEANEVVAIDSNRLRFTHPLLAHGVYRDAAPQRRRAMHRRLAELITQPELRARHLALSDTGGDPETLKALDMAAGMARRRGAPAAAAELLELALSFGSDEPLRRIRCATCYFDAGDPKRARQLLEATLKERPTSSLRAEALIQLAVVRLYDDSFVEAAELLETGLRDSGDDAGLRARLLVTLSFALINAGQPELAYARVQEAVRESEHLDNANLLSSALGMRAVLDFMGGRGFDEDSLRRAVELEEPDQRAPLAFRPSVQMTLVRAWTGGLDAARDAMADLRQRCVTLGEEGELIFLAFHLTLIDIWRGDFDSAAITADETMLRASQLGGDFPLFIALTTRAAVAAYVGRADDARSDIVEAIAAAHRCGSMRLAEWPATLAGFVEVSLGDYHAALNALAPLFPILKTWPDATEIISASYIPEAVEALVGLGRLDDAEPFIDALDRNGRRLDRAWMLAVGGRCRAMLLAARGDLTAAMAAAESAMTEHERLPMPFERARTQLLLGQLQRRQRHRDAAVATLREALQTFEDLGTRLWAERARSELARGMPGRRRAEGLTPSEHRVAELAAAGMNNKDIAAALFITPKTVEVNLSRIYRKLNVHSRVELYRTFNSAPEIDDSKE